jgi:hypothetical protein
MRFLGRSGSAINRVREGGHVIAPLVFALLGVAALAETGDPSRLVVTPLLQPVIETMWRTSPTFKAQCARLRQAPSLIVTVSIGSRPRVGAARGRVYVDRSAGLAARADILIAQDFRSLAELVEVLAHELEHVIEQLDGVELRADSSHGMYQLANGSFETARAVHIGQQVSGEVDAANRVDRKGGSR